MYPNTSKKILSFLSTRCVCCPLLEKSLIFLTKIFIKIFKYFKDLQNFKKSNRHPQTIKGHYETYLFLALPTIINVKYFYLKNRDLNKKFPNIYHDRKKNSQGTFSLKTVSIFVEINNSNFRQRRSVSG